MKIAKYIIVKQDNDEQKYDAEGVYNDTIEIMKETINSIQDNGANDRDIIIIDTCNKIIKSYKLNNYKRVNDLWNEIA